MQQAPGLSRSFLLATSIAAAVVLGACNDGVKQSSGAKRSGAAQPARGGDELSLMDEGDEAIGDEAIGDAGVRRPSARPAAPSSAKAAASDAGNGRWSVMLATFAQADHAERAKAFRTELVRQYPELSSAMVRRVGKGSAIVIGRFEGPEDKAAQAELKRVKAIERNGGKPFAGAMLLRTATEDAAVTVKPHDLRSLRAKFPSVRPLYSLQVAAWSTFGEKGADYAAMRAAAERYCAELRGKGFDAWFHHDEDKETSSVTVGSFDRRAYDARSTLFSPEVEDLMRQFPAHLTNGEPVLIPVDPANPKGRTKPQASRLVEVPLF
jgi:cell division septation protein DedD